jgi:hypothetical protein
VLSCLPAAVCASPDPGLRPAGMIAMRAADLRSLPGTAVARGTLLLGPQPLSGEAREWVTARRARPSG